MKRKLPTVVYGGFVDDKLDFIDCDTGWGGFGRDRSHYPMMPALFKTREHARYRYKDVRRIVIDKENPNG